MTPSTDYWAAMAQVLPVVAFAVVVESRAIVYMWSKETPRLLRGCQSLLWAGCLVLLGFSESAALRALRGESVSSHWAAAAEWAVSFGIGVLVLSPALEIILKANPEPIARVFTWHPLFRLTLARYHVLILWHMRRADRGMVRQRQLMLEGDRLRQQIVDGLNEGEEFLISLDSLGDSISEELRETRDTIRPKIAQMRNQAEKFGANDPARWEAFEAEVERRVKRRSDYLDRKREMKRLIGQTTKAERERLEDWLRSFPKGGSEA